MKKISKKEIRDKVTVAMTQALTSFEIAEPSKKTRRTIDKVSKKLSTDIKRDLKKKQEKISKASASKKKKNKKSRTAEASSQRDKQ
jgi:hypothetical protein